MKSNRQRSLEIMLNDWADWEFTRNGYPAATAECHAGQGGSPNRPGSRVPKGVEEPVRIAKVKGAVNALGDFHPELRLVVELRYRRRTDGLPRPTEAQIEDFMHCYGKGARTYSEWLGRAHAWLDGRLAE